MRYTSVEDVSQLKASFETPFNPPHYSSSFTEKNFDEEYWKIYAAVRNSLASLGMFSYTGSGDFCMNETRGSASRWISVVFTTDKMWNENLLPLAESTIRNQEQDYTIYFSHDLMEFDLFHILLSKESAIGCCDDVSLLKHLGFPSSEMQR